MYGYRFKSWCHWQRTHERTSGRRRLDRPLPRLVGRCVRRGESEAASDGISQEDAEPIRDFGIIDLVEEFTALRHELKLQTKSGRGLSEQTETVLRRLAAGDRTVPIRRAQGGTGGMGRRQGAALGLADLDEALDRGRRVKSTGPEGRSRISPRKSLEAALERASRQPVVDPPPTASLVPHERLIEIVRRDGASRHGLFDSFLEGFGLIQKRLHRLMAAEQIEQIPCEGRAVDPELMTVIEVVDSHRQPAGTVTKELRRGYTWSGRVFRFAEVQACVGPAASEQGQYRSESTGTKSHPFQGDADQEKEPRSWPADTIIGIDLGTTNSEVAVIRDGRAVVLDEDGDPILPSVVGLDPQGRLLVGKPPRNQYVLAPERTIRSIKRKMGQEVTVALGDQKYSPQEISAIILRTLKHRAEKALGHAVSKAVITVPAFFNDGQRQATREAGELAGLEVVRIINEPTAAVLTYDPHPPEMERLLVYDLGGGTFDVSVAQVENGVVEIHGQPRRHPARRRRLRPAAARPRLRRVRQEARHRPAAIADLQGPGAPRRRGRQEAALVRGRHHDRGRVHRREEREAAQPRAWRSPGTNTRS